MVKNPHYKYLVNNSMEIFDEDGNIVNYEIDNEENTEIKKHYRLLQVDEIAKAYYPYLGRCFQWTNEEKYYIVLMIKERGNVILPHEVKMLINEHRQKNNAR